MGDRTALIIFIKQEIEENNGNKQVQVSTPQPST